MKPNTAAMALIFVFWFGLALWFPDGGTLWAQSPLPTPTVSPLATPAAPEEPVFTESLYLPIVYGGEDVAQVIDFPCDYNDCDRGQLYRDLMDGTVDVMSPIVDWAMTSCVCGLETARYAGAAFGIMIGRVFRIIRLTLEMVGHLIQSAINLIVQVFDIFEDDAETPSISCTGDSEGICIGIAAVIALTDAAGGYLTVLILIGLSILSFYLAMYIIKEVREMLQPTGADE